MRTALLLLLILPTLASAQTVIVREVLIREVAKPANPSLEADSLDRALADGSWQIPVAGVADPDGATWQRAEADSAGWIDNDALVGGYAFATVTVDADTTMILEAMGYRGVYVNGEPRVGNIYGHTDQWESWQPHFDFSLLPVQLHAGDNHLLFFGNRYGLLRARLLPAESPLLLNSRDTTLPDLVVGEIADTWGAIVVMNATDEVVTDARLEVALADGPPIEIVVPVLPPFGVRKIGFPVRGYAGNECGSKVLRVALSRRGRTLADADLELAVKSTDENRRVTFVSDLDGSVQYYGFLPARGGPGPKALVLSLHGASVEAINQSGSYAPLSWGHVVAPTNRRPFGFNWEDWGRLDALEVLDQAIEQLQIDPDRVYLTGHSMGGHGSWHLATLHPDRFAAVGPSAGWVSFWSYRPDRSTGADSPLAAMVARATLPSRTLQMSPNLAGLGVYVLHGGDDEVVSADEARAVLARLEEFHGDFTYHEQPGVGHWWDLSDAPGADCVAWAPMFDFFARHRRPANAEVRQIRFQTPSPGVNAWRHWVCVAAQERAFIMSVVDVQLDPLDGHITGTTENVAVLGLDLNHTELDSLRVELDGNALSMAVPADGRVWLARGEHWSPITAPDPANKGPHRHGGFREAFLNRTQLVYGTQGTPEENAWARAKARYDAEHLWYQGNASMDVLPDTLYDPTADTDRNVILFGNADTHAHWQALWDDDAVSVTRGRVAIDDRIAMGNDLAVLAVRPRPGSDIASVGIVAASGLPGFRLTDRRPYLAPGVAYPDLTMLVNRDDGSVVRAAGFFGRDWSVTDGEFLWADEP